SPTSTAVPGPGCSLAGYHESAPGPVRNDREAGKRIYGCQNPKEIAQKRSRHGPRCRAKGPSSFSRSCFSASAVVKNFFSGSNGTLSESNQPCPSAKIT